MKDEFAGQGGSYLIDKDGKRVRIEEPTQDHPEGNRARDAEGKPLDVAPLPPAPLSPKAGDAAASGGFNVKPIGSRKSPPATDKE